MPQNRGKFSRQSRDITTWSRRDDDFWRKSSLHSPRNEYFDLCEFVSPPLWAEQNNVQNAFFAYTLLQTLNYTNSFFSIFWKKTSTSEFSFKIDWKLFAYVQWMYITGSNLIANVPHFHVVLEDLLPIFHHIDHIYVDVMPCVRPWTSERARGKNLLPIKI